MKKLFLYASLLCLGTVSCTKDYVVPEGELPSWLGESIYKELQSPKELDGTFTTYCRLVDDMNYAEVLNRTGSKTIFPANDEAFERFFKDGNNKFGAKSYEELTIQQKAELLFSSMLDNAILVGTLSNRQGASGDVLQGQSVKHATNMSLYYSVRPFAADEMPVNNKFFEPFKAKGSSMLAVFDNTKAPMVHFTGEYMLNNNMTITGDECDFKIITGHAYENGDAYIFDRKVIKGDVTCQNGYIHQLDEVLLNPGNMAEILRSGEDTRYLSRILDYYAVPYPDTDLSESVDDASSTAATQETVYAIRYLSKFSQGDIFNKPVRNSSEKVADNQLLTFDPGWNYYKPTKTAHEDSEIAAFLAANDQAVEDYFFNESPYILKNLGVPNLPLTSENLNAHLDAVYNNDPSIFTSILNNMMKNSLSKTVPSTFSTVQNDAFEPLGITKSDLYMKADGNYDVTIANNGVIFKLKKLFGPKLFNSVLGPASVYQNMRTMGQMLNDHQTTAGVASALGADMYYYLLSMKARYGVLVPTDSETQFIVIDPASTKDDDGPKGLLFRFDPTATGSFNVLVNKYKYVSGPYNSLSSYDPTPLAENVNIETGQFNTQIKDLLNYCTIVLADSTETGKGSPVYGFYGNRFYKTKHGGAVVVDGNKMAGGLQLSDPSQWSTITQTFDINSADATIENGTVYQLDFPLQPTVTSVMQTLEAREEFNNPEADYDNDAPEYDHFLNFCLQFSDETVLTFAGILTGAEETSQKNAKMKPYVVINNLNNWNMLSAYNYTIYAPTYEAMVIAQRDMGLPKWKDILTIVHDWESVAGQYGFNSEDDAKAYVKEKIDIMSKFVRYHTQNSSLFADKFFKNYDPETGKTEPEPTYSTFCTNAIGIADRLTVTGGNNQLVVQDATGAKVTINASSATANMLARDITTSGDGDFKAIESSSFVTIHGISTPLCFNKNGQY